MTTKKQTSKTNQIYIQKRLEALEGKLLCNATRGELCSWYSSEFKLSPSQCDKDIHQVKKSWFELFQAEKELRVYQHIKKLEALYRTALSGEPSVASIRVALDIELAVCEIDGTLQRYDRKQSDIVSSLLQEIEELKSRKDTLVCIN